MEKEIEALNFEIVSTQKGRWFNVEAPHNLKCSQVDNVERDTFMPLDKQVERFMRAGVLNRNAIASYMRGYSEDKNDPIQKFYEREAEIIKNNKWMEEQEAKLRNMSSMELIDKMRESEKRKKNYTEEKEGIEKEIKALQLEIERRTKKETRKKKKETDK